MKVIRFLTTVIIFQLICFGAKVNSQEIAEFEIQKPTPVTPFPAHMLPLDDNGHVLPSNQCKSNVSLYPTNRCEFGAGLEEDFVTTSNSNTKKVSNEIDLSPLSFQCMGSGCEFEYANSAREFQAELAAKKQVEEALDRAEAKKIIESVFAKTSLENEAIESQFDEFEFIPYLDPARQLGLELVTEPELTLSSLEDYRALTQYWINAVLHSGQELFNQPMEVANDQLIELECRLCGSPVLNLFYEVRASIQKAKADLAHEKELLKIKQNTIILQGFASITKMMGESLIDISDSIVAISSKSVESLSSNAKHKVR